MEKKEKETLERNEDLLIRNIICSEDLYELLQHYSVIPATMLKDVKNVQDRQKQNKTLLQCVKLRGGDSFKRFRHVLALSGHTFLADQLYEDDSERKILHGDDLFGRFSTVFSGLNDNVRGKLLRFLESRLREKSLLAIWQQNPTKMDEKIERRKLDFESDRDVRKKIEAYRRQVQENMKNQMEVEKLLQDRETEIQILKHELATSERRFKEDLRVQSRFNAANNNSILRMKGKYDNLNHRINVMNRSILNFLGQEMPNTNMTKEPEDDNMSLLECNISCLIQSAKKVEDDKISQLNERESILLLLNKSLNKTKPIVDILRKYIDKENKTKLALCREIDKLGAIIQNKEMIPESSTSDMRLIKNRIATLRVEIEHLQKRLSWKEAQIIEQAEQLALLQYKDSSDDTNRRHTPARTKAAITNVTPTSRNSNLEETGKNAYGAYERRTANKDKAFSSSKKERTSVSNSRSLHLPAMKMTKSPEFPKRKDKNRMQWKNDIFPDKDLDALNVEEIASQLVQSFSQKNSQLPPLHKKNELDINMGEFEKIQIC